MSNQGAATRKRAPETIILVKKVRRRQEPHGGAWKVAYADFVTAMLALFIVLWLLSSDQKVQKAVGGYFQDPTGDGRMMGSTRSGSGVGLAVSPENIDQIKEQIRQAMAKQVVEFDQLKDYVQLTATDEGLRIELIENEKGTFFNTGHTNPTLGGSEILKTLGGELGQLPNRIVIEGHTDSLPYANSDYYSNWELSVDRANTARKLMQRYGLWQGQVSQIRGFADQQPRLPENPGDPSNRRVSIIVRYNQVEPGSPADAEPASQHSSTSPPHADQS